MSIAYSRQPPSLTVFRPRGGQRARSRYGNQPKSGARRLVWKDVLVDRRRAMYGEGGSGPVLLFLHGWGLDPRGYQRVCLGS